MLSRVAPPLSLVLLACSSGSAHTAPSDARTEPPAALTTGSAEPGVNPTTVSTPPSDPASAFITLMKLEGTYRFFPIDNALIVAGLDAQRAEAADVNRVGLVDGDIVKFDDGLSLPGLWTTVVGMAGSWPDDVRMLAVGSTGRAPIPEHFGIINGKLQDFSGCSKKECGGGTRYVGVFKTKNSVVALDAPHLPFYGGMSFTTLKGSKIALTPRRSPADCRKGGMGSEVLLAAPVTVAALPDGAIVAFGGTCKEELAIETWKGSGAVSTVTMLPGQSQYGDSDAQFVIGPTGDAWLVNDRLFHLENGSWNYVDSPRDEALRGALARDGTFYLVTASALYKREKDRWDPVPLPSDAKPQDVAVDKNGVLYVIAGGVLMRERKTGEAPPTVTVPVSSKAPLQAKRVPPAGGPQCKDNVVVLYGFTKVTPDDYDFPLTRKAVKGHTEFKEVKFVVTKQGGKKFFAAKTPTFAAAKDLVKVIEKGVQGAKPGIVCDEPEVVRELKLDLMTGDVIK